MMIQILYDNRSRAADFQKGWGFSALVNGRVLLDTGENWPDLARNALKLGVDFTQISAVVLSHDHWDHTGGLLGLLEQNPGVRVYGCPGFTAKTVASIREISSGYSSSAAPVTIDREISTSGEITCEYKHAAFSEQALFLKTPAGVIVLTGCAHPGIVEMARGVKDVFPQEGILAVLGGFHLKDVPVDGIIGVIDQLKALGVRKAGPCHCSGDLAIRLFRERFGRDFLDVSSGAEWTFA